jgi:glucan biosynthesis protein C
MKLLIHKNRNDSAGSSDARLVGLDAARGVLLVLGVVLHAANIYTTGGKWIISDGQNNYIFDLLVGIIHEFRMPTFFWISGYFCALTCVRSGSEKMLQRRLPRLAIPLLASWLMLNSLQEGFVAWWNGSDPILVVLNGVPLFHLWFLVDLLIFIITLPLYLPWLRQISDRMMSRWSLLESPVIFIGLFVFVI